MMTRRFLFIAVLAYPFLMAAQSAQIKDADLFLQADSEKDLHLEAGEKRSLHLQIPSDHILSVSFEQMEGSIRVSWIQDGVSAETVDPHSNKGGKHSSIVFHSIGLASQINTPDVPGDASPTVTGNSGSFLVQNPGKSVVEVRILTGSFHSPSATDIVVAQAERDEARAMVLSSNHSQETAKESLDLLKSVEKRWRSTHDQIELTRVIALEAASEAFSLNDGASALKRLPELIDLATQVAAKDAVEAANAYKTAAFVYAKQANYDQALDQYNKALQLFEQTGDLYNRVVVLENRAKVERIQGNNAIALADVQAAIPLAQQNRDGRGELALEVERGAIASASGQLSVAYEANLRALKLAETTPDEYLEALAWSDIGTVSTELHNFEEANRAFDHAEAIWKRTSNAYGQMQTLEDRAELRLAQEDFAGARSAFALGTEQAAKSSLHREHSYFLRGLAVSEMRLGKVADAREHLDEALKEAENVKLTDLLSTTYSSAGDLDAIQNRWQDADVHWQHADTVAKERGDTLDHVIALGGLIRSAIQLNNLDSASERCQQAMSALESMRAEISDADLRLSFFSSQHDIYDLCVETEMKRDDQAAAFDAAERGRARSLMDEAAASGVNAEFPSGLLDRIHENQSKLAQVRRYLVQPTRSQHPPGIEEDVDRLFRERERLRVEAEDSGLSGKLAAASLPIAEQEVMQHLDNSTAMLSYWLGNHHSYVWLITNQSVSVHVLSSRKILNAQTKQYLTYLLAPLDPRVDRTAAERVSARNAAQSSALMQGLTLRRMLMPMRLPQRIHRLLIVKDEALFTLSFASLPDTALGYLNTNFEIATEPSAAFAFYSQKQSVSLQSQVVVFSDPSDSASEQLHPETNRAPQTAALNKISWVEPLPFALQEAQLIRRTFGERRTKIFTGPAASRANALALNWGNFGMAHFATHAIFRSSHPELSGLVLASSGNAIDSNSNWPNRESILSFSDVLAMRPHLQLAVLSACNSGVGKFVPGEGMLALDNAFLAGGTARVIGTLWPVEDEASSVFMSYFYAALAHNHSPIRSLQQAQQEMAATSQWGAPYYWGAFSLSGDWYPFSGQ